MRAEHIYFAYENKTVFEDFSLDFGSGSVCLMGPSGCGKTTLLRLAAGLETPQRGEIIGKPAHPAICFQENRLLPWGTVGENVRFVLPKAQWEEGSRMIYALELAPEMRVSELSGGMARRAALARALAFPADLLVLDEPFNGLDEPLMRRVAARIRERGIPVLAASHSLPEAQALGARVISLD